MIIISCVSQASAQTNDPGIQERVVEQLKAEVPKWIDESAMPGAAVAIVDDKSILWQMTFGRTHREGGPSITEETLFSIQSMSKSFSALGVLMAVQDGLLDLDTPITAQDDAPDPAVPQSRIHA